MKILLSIDSSEFSKAVITEVAARPWPADTLIVVLTVVDSFALNANVGYLEPFVKNENEAAAAMAASL